MASFTSISQSQLLSYKPQIKMIQTTLKSLPIKYPLHKSYGGLTTKGLTCKKMVLVIKMSATHEPEERYPGESKGFAEEMRQVAIKMHTREQVSREGQKQPEGAPVAAQWEPAIEGYLRFLVDSKLVYETLEGIIAKAEFPQYAELRTTHLERSEKLARDLEWFKEQGHAIPEPSSPGLTYAQELEKISKTDPQALMCHYYNIYFAHSAGGRSIGKFVAEKILNGKVLEFYKWDIDLPILLQIVKMKLNKVAGKWTRDQKNHCLKETEKSFNYSSDILRLILS